MWPPTAISWAAIGPLLQTSMARGIDGFLLSNR